MPVFRKDAAGQPLTVASSHATGEVAVHHLTRPRKGQKDNQMATKITVNRSAISGKFVTPQYAAKHPRTTEKEHYKKK